MNFYKYQGAGNDFILVEGMESDNRGAFIRHLCHRHFGIGGDGLILLEKSSACDVRMRIFNSDGLEASMCGNALRCVVLHLNKESISIETAAGVCYGKLYKGAILATLPYAKELEGPFLLSDGRTGYHVDTGVTHLLIFQENIETESFESEARALRFNPQFGEGGVNVSYVAKRGGDLFIRTYEKGVEKETLACGSASAAAAFITRKNDKKERSEYTVYPVSEKALKFTFDQEDKIWMEGPAALVFSGQMIIQNTNKIERAVL